MIVSILQPYLFPYIGYFQLINHSDICVLSDDVQYIKNGWINRNRILSHGKAAWLTRPVLYGPHHLSIRDRRYQPGTTMVNRCLRQIRASYQHAPHFDTIFPVLQETLKHPDLNVAAFNIESIRRLAKELGITTRFVVASELAKTPCLAGQELVIDICKRLNATRYVNPLGGMALYHRDRFAIDGITLGFLRSTVPEYAQFSNAGVRSLSIIDVMMFNDIRRMRELMEHYRIDGGSTKSAPTGGGGGRR